MTWVENPHRRSEMPSLPDVAEAWATLPFDEILAIFPNLKQAIIGWGEPSCFRCGWLAPCKEACDYPASWKDNRRWKATWEAATGWLERAHLHDRICGGSAEPLNLVPLCPICHERQPTCATREKGVAYVNEIADHADIGWAIQMHTDHFYRERRKPGKETALRLLYRAHAEASAAMRYAQRKALEAAA